MSSNIINEDLRSIKTRRALYAATCSLLKKSNFKKITIKGICEEAQISRAAFYAHFLDKYDLLKHLMIESWPKDFQFNDTYEKMEETVNSGINENLPLLKNLVQDADNETKGILFDFILSTMNLSVERKHDGEIFSRNVVLSNFYAGGVISYLLWLVENKFPPDVPPMNKYFYEIIHEFQEWKSKFR